MSKLQQAVFTSVLSLMAVMVFSSDAYVPSLPAMTEALNASHTAVKLTIALYLLGLGVGPFLFGPVSDHFGRKPITLIGLVIAMLGVVICLFAPNISLVIIGRFVQGLGIASSMTVNRAMLLDVFRNRKLLSKVSSFFGVIMSLFPALAPIVGGYVQQIFGWRANFALMLFLLIAVFIWVVLILPETHHGKPDEIIQISRIRREYGEILMNKKFIVFPICASLGFAAMMAYLAMSPFIFQVILGLSAVEYGWLGIVLGLGIVTGALMNMRLIRDFESESLIIIGGILCLSSSSVMLLIALWGVVTVSAIVVPFYFFLIGLVLIFSNTFAAGLIQIEKNKGLASAVYSSVQLSGAGVANIIAALLHINNQIPLATLLFIFSGLILLIFFFYMKSIQPKFHSE